MLYMFNFLEAHPGYLKKGGGGGVTKFFVVGWGCNHFFVNKFQ